NSQFSPLLVTEDPITLSPEIFSPDNDGFDDVLNIHYNYQEPGRNASITIYDARGRKIRRLIDHELLGTSGQFSWDGLDDERQKAPIGIYIIYVEVFDLNGNVDHYKKTAVLATRL
ncbi:MAG: gliding motility-associated C-terminal domain-containing protein, partial [Bacteroidales bacterium]|nr:gliding motility-associated C-terminal domain-containing protein [Bacteroidales bacterium]